MRYLAAAARTAAGCGLCCLAGAALADDGAAAPVLVVALAEIVARANETPAEPARLSRGDPVDDPSRTLAGRRGENSDISYRWWLSRGRADVGLGVGTLTYALRPAASTAMPVTSADAGAAPFAVGSFATLGMRYRTSAHSSVYADAIHWRGGNGLDYGDSVAGKVGVEFKSARSQWSVAYGGLGLRLAGDARMTLKVRRGGLGLYMRSAF